MILTNVNVNLYKTFLALYETCNTTRAAERLFLGQTGISRNIRELEKQLDIKLFIPHNKGVKPTAASHELYKYIKSAFIEINNGESMLQEFRQFKKGQLRIGCHSYIANYILLDYISEFIKQHPLVNVKIVSHISKADLDVLLEKHDVEFIIDVVSSLNSTEKVAVHGLAQLDNVFYASKEFVKNHNLGTAVSKQQLSKLPLLLYAKKHHTMQALHQALGTPLSHVFEVTTSELIYGMVRKNIGVGYALSKFLDNCFDNEQMVKLNIEDVQLPKSNLAVISNKKDKNPIISSFINGLIEHCSKI